MCHAFATAQMSLVENRYFETMTTDDKLPFDKFNSGAIDRDGFIWMSSVHGIVRYDGYEFKVYRNDIDGIHSIVNGRPGKILIHKDRMWIGGSLGLTILDLMTGEFTNLSELEPNDSLWTSDFRKIELDPEGNLWVKNSQGLIKCDAKTLRLTHHKIDRYLNAVGLHLTRTCDLSWDKNEDNIVWIGTEYGLLKYNVETEEYINYLSTDFTENSVKDSLEYDLHTTVMADSSGIVYTGIWSTYSGKARCNGVRAFDPKTESWNMIHIPKTRNESQKITGIWHKSMDELWIGLPTRGLATYNTKTESFVFYDHDKSNPHTFNDHEVRFPLMDAMNNLYVATISGLSIAHNQHNVFKREEFVTLDVLNSAGEDKRGSYVFNYLDTDRYEFYTRHGDKGVFVKDKISSRSWIIPFVQNENSPQSNYRQGLFEDHNGDIYVTSGTNLMVLDVHNNRMTKFKTDEGEEVTFDAALGRHILEDDENRIWIGSQGEEAQLIGINASRDSIVYYKNEPNDPNSLIVKNGILDMDLDDKGRVWITSGNGTSCFNPNNKTFENYSMNGGVDHKLISNFCYNTVTDTLGRKWISSYVLYCIDETKPEGEKIEVVSNKEGLPGSLVRTMKLHPDGTIWMVTDNGFVHFNPYDKEIIVYTTKEGIPRNQMWDDYFYITVKGEVRISSHNGSIEYQPEYEKSLHVPSVVLTDFEVKGKTWGNSLGLNTKDTIFLSYKENFFAFKYATMNFAPRFDNTYQYQLEGVDDDWVEGGTRRYASYTDVDGGYYTFKVKAQDRFGNNADKILSKVIFISTPYWKTWWFRGIIGLIILALLAEAIQYRMNNIRREKDLKAKLAENEMIALRAQMNPHFLFNTINSIKRFIIKNETSIAADHLTKFSRLVRLILNNSNSKTIVLKDELEALRLYIDMERMRFDDKFEFEINIDSSVQVDNIEIPPMLLQPFVENAIWHGLMHKTDGEGRVVIKLNVIDEYLVCTIEDNGIGRKKAAEMKSKSALKKKSLGMELTKRRIELLDQFAQSEVVNLEIIDLIDDSGQSGGTKVIVRIPITTNK